MQSKEMCLPILKSGHNVTMDNWFTDVDMVEDFADNGLSVAGKLKKKKVSSTFSL